MYGNCSNFSLKILKPKLTILWKSYKTPDILNKIRISWKLQYWNGKNILIKNKNKFPSQNHIPLPVSYKNISMAFIYKDMLLIGPKDTCILF